MQWRGDGERIEKEEAGGRGLEIAEGKEREKGGKGGEKHQFNVTDPHREKEYRGRYRQR